MSKKSDKDDKRNYVDQWHLPSYIVCERAPWPIITGWSGILALRLFSRPPRTKHKVMSMRPRPVRYVHFLTETVGTNRDGPTKLFLDTVNPKENFWDPASWIPTPTSKPATKRHGSHPD